MTFGKVFASTFTGSMVGAGPVVHAVWSFVIANGYGGQVDLHPSLLATAIGRTTAEDISEAITFLCAPDPNSRSEEAEGRRLRHLRGVTYEIVNHKTYAGMRGAEDRREYNRTKQREARARTVKPVIDMSKTEVDGSKTPLFFFSSPLISSDLDPEGVQGEGPLKQVHPTAQAGTGAAAPSPEIAIKTEQESRPIGVPSAAAAPPHLAPKSRKAPRDLEPTEVQRARCRELRFDADKLMRKFKTQAFNRDYDDWPLRFDAWIEDEDALRDKGRPWVTDKHRAYARKWKFSDAEFAACADDYAERHSPAERPLKEAREGFGKYLEARARGSDTDGELRLRKAQPRGLESDRSAVAS